MGVCCCKCKNSLCDKPSAKDSKTSIHRHNDNINLITSVSDDEDEDNTNEQISEMILCDNTMTELCPISIKLINILSTYHLFIHNYDPKQQHDFKNNICDIICTKMNGYDLLNLRDDYHHIITYHDANNKFMQTMFNHIMQLNKQNHIDNLYDITAKLDNDEQKLNYFGHSMDNEISMIQCLNQMHHDCTYNFIQNHDHSNNSHIDDNNVDSNRDSADQIQQICRKPTPNPSNCVENDTNNKEQHIDIKYTKTGKELRKIGKLKLKKASKKRQRDKLKVKQQKILNDDSWMNKEYEKNKKSKHVTSESIQMLGNTKLVSNNLWRKSLVVLQENSSFDLTSVDMADVETDSEESYNDINYIETERKDAMFYGHYGVDQI